MNTCTYCEEYKPVKIWKETGEKVCQECRIRFVEQEFEETKEEPWGVNLAHEMAGGLTEPSY